MVDSQGAVGIGAGVFVTLVDTKDAPVLAQTDEVETGSKVNGIFLSVEIVNTGTDGVLANAYMLIYKNPGGNLTIPEPNVVGADDNKRFIIHQEMVMLQQLHDSNPRTLFKGVIAIPKGYRRMGPNDQIGIEMFSPGIAFNYCLQAHYKEFR